MGLIITSVNVQDTPVDVEIVSAVGFPGETLVVDIVADSHNVPVLGFHVNLAYNGAQLPQAVGKRGPGTPFDWLLQSNQAKPGDFRFLGLHQSGASAMLKGTLLQVEFSIPNNPIGDAVIISTSLVSFSNSVSERLPVRVTDGLIIMGGTAGTIIDLPEEFVSVRVTPQAFRRGRREQMKVLARKEDGEEVDISDRVKWLELSDVDTTRGGLVTIQEPGRTSLVGIFT